MHRERVYVCTYGAGDGRREGRVRAWDDLEAAELFARELEVERDGGRVAAAEIRVRAAASPRDLHPRAPDPRPDHG